LLANESWFQRTKERDIWILFAKVVKGQSFFGRGFKIVSSTEVDIDFGDFCKMMINDGGFR